MKVLVISQYWSPENGVPQRRWAWLTRLLIESGHEVTVLTPPPHYLRKIGFRDWLLAQFDIRNEIETGGAGEVIIRTGYVPAGNSLTLRVLNQAAVAIGACRVLFCRRGYLQNYTPDLIVGTVPALPTAAVTLLASRIYRRPYLVDLRDAWPALLQESHNWNKGTGRVSFRERLLSNGPLQILTAMTKRMLTVCLHEANGIIVTSSELEADLHRRGFIKPGKQDSEVVRNVFPPETDYIATSVRQAKVSELNVLYAGTLGRAQNLSNAIEAANIATEMGVKLNLVLVGAGAAKKQLANLAAESKANVQIVSRQAASELERYYSWADTALVHLTDWPALRQAVPSKVYELMAARIHITAVVEGEAAELVRELDAGHVVRPENPWDLANRWKILAENRELLCVPDRARQWVKYESEKVAPQRFLSIVEKVAK